MFRIVCVLLLAVALHAPAEEVSPSKNTVPDKFVDPGGKRFSIFSGDPKRIQRANAINFADFETKLEVTPSPLSIKAAEEAPGGRPSIKLTFSVRNKGKRTYTLSFPNAQRYDFQIKNATGQVVYTWSDDKAFADSVGTILINQGDIIEYSEVVALSDFSSPATPGTYTVDAAMFNYPELAGHFTLTINP